MWKSQFLPLLRGYDLLKFVDGSSAPPSRYIQNEQSERIDNPDFITWDRQDQLILSWLLSSLTESVLAQVLDSKTSREVWTSLERMYASQSRARVYQLRSDLMRLSKGTSKMHEYYSKANPLVTHLQPLATRCLMMIS